MYHLPFQPLTDGQLLQGNNFYKDAPISMTWHWAEGLRESNEDEVIVLSQVLASPLTVGFTEA